MMHITEQANFLLIEFISAYFEGVIEIIQVSGYIGEVNACLLLQVLSRFYFQFTSFQHRHHKNIGKSSTITYQILVEREVLVESMQCLNESVR